jgi:hypothetical protein
MSELQGDPVEDGSPGCLVALTPPVSRMPLQSRRAGRGTQRWAEVRYWILLLIALAALAMSLLDFAFITEAVSVPIPGLRTQQPVTAQDAATHGFESGTDGWSARGAASNGALSQAYVFAGRSALAI